MEFGLSRVCAGNEPAARVGAGVWAGRVWAKELLVCCFRRAYLEFGSAEFGLAQKCVSLACCSSLGPRARTEFGPAEFGLQPVASLVALRMCGFGPAPQVDFWIKLCLRWK